MNYGRFSRTILVVTVLMILAVAVSAGEIHEKAQEGDLVRVKELIKADPPLLESKDAAGSTPLIAACAGGQLEVAKYLVGKGADINAPPGIVRRPNIAGMAARSTWLGSIPLSPSISSVIMPVSLRLHPSTDISTTATVRLTVSKSVRVFWPASTRTANGSTEVRAMMRAPVRMDREKSTFLRRRATITANAARTPRISNM